MDGVAFARHFAPGELRVTSRARGELQRIFRACDDPQVLGVRLFVAGRGCSGMTYALTFTDRTHEHDRVIREDGFDIYVDAIAGAYLEGAEIDFEHRPQGDTFVFNGVFRATGGDGLCGGCGAAG